MPETMEPPIISGEDDGKENQDEQSTWQQHAESVSSENNAEKLEMFKRGLERYRDARSGVKRASSDSLRKFPRAYGDPVNPKAFEMVNSAEYVRAEAHIAAAKLAMEAGESPAGSDLTIDQFSQAPGQDKRAPLVMAAGKILEYPGDTRIADIREELAEFDPDLENLDPDELAFKLAKDYVEKLTRNE